MPDTRTPPSDRRAPSSELLFLVQEVKTNQEELDRKLEAVPTDIAKALAVLMKDAFPDGDPDGHRRYHEASIKEAEAKAEFWSKMRVSVSTWGLIGVLGMLGMMAWNGFIQRLHS